MNMMEQQVLYLSLGQMVLLLLHPPVGIKRQLLILLASSVEVRLIQQIIRMEGLNIFWFSLRHLQILAQRIRLFTSNTLFVHTIRTMCLQILQVAILMR